MPAATEWVKGTIVTRTTRYFGVMGRNYVLTGSTFSGIYMSECGIKVHPDFFRKVGDQNPFVTGKLITNEHL